MAEMIKRVQPLSKPPLSMATVVGNMIYVSGQVGFDAEGRFAPDLETQTRQTLDNIRKVLEQAGSGMDRVVKTTVFLVHAADFDRMNEIYAEYFGDHPPARSTIVCGLVREGLLIEIEAIALAAQEA